MTFPRFVSKSPFDVDLPGIFDPASIAWGGHEDFDSGSGSQINTSPIGQLVRIPKMRDVPYVFVLDLEIIDLGTGLPPVALNGAAFRVTFGCGGDTRVKFFEPGIHCIIGQALNVSIRVAGGFGPARFTWRFSAHACPQDGVVPSYISVP